MRAFVIGAAGFLGTHLCQRLAASGSAVVGFDRREPAAAVPGVDWRRGDFAETETVLAAGVGCDVAYLLAGARSPSVAAVDDLAGIVAPSVRLLERIGETGIRRLVFVSSGGTVYGVRRESPIPETAPTDPISAYGINKLAVEKYALMHGRRAGWQPCVLRLSNPFGAGQRSGQGQGVIPAFFKAALSGEPLTVIGDGSTVRDYVLVDDAAEAMVLAATAPLGDHCVLNIGSGVGRTVLDVADMVERLVGRRPNRHFEPARATDVPSTVLDIRLASQVLDWRPLTSWEAAMERTFHWYRRVELS